MCCYFYYLSLEQMLLSKVTCREFIYRTLKLTYFIGVMLILPLGDITSGTMDEEHTAYQLEHAPRAGWTFDLLIRHLCGHSQIAGLLKLRTSGIEPPVSTHPDTARLHCCHLVWTDG